MSEKNGSGYGLIGVNATRPWARGAVRLRISRKVAYWGSDTIEVPPWVSTGTSEWGWHSARSGRGKHLGYILDDAANASFGGKVLLRDLVHGELPWVTILEAAWLTGKSTRTIRRWIKRGHVKHRVARGLRGSGFEVSRDSLEVYLQHARQYTRRKRRMVNHANPAAAQRRITTTSGAAETDPAGTGAVDQDQPSRDL